MTRTIIQCTLCPCRFATQVDYGYHMDAFTEDPYHHIKRFVDGTSYPPGKKRMLRRRLYKKYLLEKGIEPPSTPREDAHPPDTMEACR